MGKICGGILDRVGKTPLVQLNSYCLNMHVKPNVYAKLECENPGGSMKIRAALYIIEKAERRGKLGGHKALVIEAAVYNTAVALAVVCAAKQYKLVIVMPDIKEKRDYSLLRAYGAQVVLTPGAQGMAGAGRMADEMCRRNPHAFRPRIYNNAAAPAAYRSVASEIWRDTEGQVDILVCGVGSGAAITGIGETLKRKKRSLQVVAVEAEETKQAAVMGKNRVDHGIFGINNGEMPPLLNADIVDEIYPVSSADAYSGCVSIAANDGVLAGISSGAAVYAAVQLARIPENENRMIVALLPDTGERYLSTGLFDCNDNYIVMQ